MRVKGVDRLGPGGRQLADIIAVIEEVDPEGLLAWARETRAKMAQQGKDKEKKAA